MGLAKTDRSFLNRRRSESPARISAFGAGLLLICASAALIGCAAHSYAGVSLGPGAADPDLQRLAIRAKAGDKQAQLELGIRYEEGIGVPEDHARAERLYRLAASDSEGTIFAYSPPVGSHGRGRVIPIQTGTQAEGLLEAKARLRRLTQRNSSQGDD